MYRHLLLLLSLLASLSARHAGAEAQLPTGMVAEPRTRPPYEPWMLARLDSLRDRDPSAVLLGDSLVAAWPADLHAGLLPAGALNLGAGGDTVANLLWRVRRAIRPGMRMTDALLLVGTNDLPFRSGRDIAAAVGVVASEVLASAPGSCLTVVGLLPRRDGREDFNDKIRDANRSLATLRLPRTRFVNPYDALRAACPATGPCSLLYKDSVHLTRAGYELLTSLVADASQEQPCGR